MNTQPSTTSPSPIHCKCGQLLSSDGVTWTRQGYRVNRRVDGSTTVGAMVRTDAKGAKPMCKACCTAKAFAVDAADLAKRQAKRLAR